MRADPGAVDIHGVSQDKETEQSDHQTACKQAVSGAALLVT